MSPIPNFRSDQDLLPAIAQDFKTKRVLMLAWMNAAAFDESRQTGYATYFSRSRQRLWRKGEESGHRQRVISIAVDCDGDTILLQVEQAGAACHEGYASCFFRELQPSHLKDVPLRDDCFQVTEPRIVDPDSVYKS